MLLVGAVPSAVRRTSLRHVSVSPSAALAHSREDSFWLMPTTGQNGERILGVEYHTTEFSISDSNLAPSNIPIHRLHGPVGQAHTKRRCVGVFWSEYPFKYWQ